ncbi:hypothetical protein [Parabacteroides sp. AF18-52]|uniref:hypothetical protein n=1 Tax=Parabacteroides sp. AF18-52 TaxID=2292242 RepID=UPI0011C40805|nr:hypothetical protein [Parabacteroides sp. AF18-52]
MVVSFTGTWIETNQGKYKQRVGLVVSFTGTWIETSNLAGVLTKKLVVSFTGTWIETEDSDGLDDDEPSYPLRVRELKLGSKKGQGPGYSRILYGYVS